MEKFDNYNTKDYADAIYKAMNYFDKNNELGLDYLQWVSVVKAVLDNENTYTNGFKPSHEQYRALLTLAKRTLIDACPGSGKTATLIFKIFLDGAIFKYNSDSQLALTYTNSAAAEMQDRYIKLCNKYNSNPGANIRTIHSFAKQVETALSSYKVLDPKGMEVMVLKESEEDSDEYDDWGSGVLSWDSDEDEYDTVFISDREFISKAIDSLQLSYDYINNINSIEGWISTIIEKDITTQEEFNQIVEFSSLENIYLSDLLDIHNLTKEYRKSYNVMNFSDMLVGLYERLTKTKSIDEIKDPIIRKMLDISVIYVDEYQDISPLQFKIIQELIRLNPKARLFAVGDADQAIYSFRGSYTGFLVDFKKYFTDKVNWKDNSYKKVGKIGGFSEYNKKDSDKLLGTFIKDYIEENSINTTSKNEEENQTNLIWEDNVDNPNEIVVTEDDIDIIYFTINRRCGEKIIDLANDLIVKNKYRYPKTMEPFRKVDAKLSIIVAEKEKDFIEPILNEIKTNQDLVTTDFSKYAIIYREHRQCSRLLIDLLKLGVPVNIKREAVPVFFNETRDILNIFSMIMNSSNPNLIERYLYKVFASVNKSRAKDIAYRMKTEGPPFSKYLPDTKTAQEDLYKLRLCYKSLTGGDISEAISIVSASYVKHYLAYFSKTLFKVDSAEYYLKNLDAKDYKDLVNIHETIKKNFNRQNSTNNGVILSTMHSVKGLEFENVYILPIGDSTMRKESIINKMKLINDNYIKEYEEEERRLLYVAITRAKDNLTVFLENSKDMFCKDLLNYQLSIY